MPFAGRFAFTIFCIYEDVCTPSVSLQRNHSSIAFALQFLVFAEFVYLGLVFTPLGAGLFTPLSRFLEG